ncbi:MAG: ribosomal L7Ae/L30e/S12e/Gadd45 family protein [Eubacteriales bacterium]|nr:ribosomal L7Ae/L30e/S12e/Gadd45 family protein [Eubacteriales bacterium]
MTDKLLNLLGLCRRAGKAALGYDPVIDSIKQRKAKLIIISSDCSDNTKKGVLLSAHRGNVPCEVVPYTKDDISLSLGKYTAVLSILDQGFAKSAQSLICSLKED